MGWVMGLEPTTPGTTIQCSANRTIPTIFEVMSYIKSLWISLYFLLTQKVILYLL